MFSDTTPVQAESPKYSKVELIHIAKMMFFFTLDVLPVT